MRVQFILLHATVILSHFCNARSFDEAQQRQPTFIRSAIESNPWDESKWEVSQKQNYKSLLTSIGSESLPLRTAVEELPYIPITSRIPLRDAVEYRPVTGNSERYRVHDEEEFEYHRQARTNFDGSPFAAYVQSRPQSTYDNQVPPFRADSPFQQLIDRQTYHKITGKLMQELFKRTVKLNPDVPVLLALGGWTDSTGDKYSRMVASSSARRNFILRAVDFLKTHQFSGLHFDWNYPVCWQSDCKKGSSKDKSNFATLIEVIQ
uniref:CSON001622 protein n=1 Tax=Culicoides sonorensis TaxID=179676 RepID=A0A336KYW9_CULSO